MAGKNINGIEVIGTEAIADVFKEIAPKYARNLMRSVNHALASDLTKRIKTAVPKRTGNLKKSLKAKRRKSPPDKPVSEVIFESGKGAKNDGFYWRFVEHGTANTSKHKGTPAQPFVQPKRDEFNAEMPNLIDEQFKKKLVKLIEREKKKAAKKAAK